MKKINRLLLILTIGAGILSCAKVETKKLSSNDEASAAPRSQPEKISAEFPVGGYRYNGYNRKGEKIVEGRLSIASREKERVEKGFVDRLKGDWNLQSVREEPLIGSQVGGGIFTGEINGNSFHVNLNPNVSDANVILDGQIDERGMRGKWRAVGYAGVVNEGTFDGQPIDRE